MRFPPGGPGNREGGGPSWGAPVTVPGGAGQAPGLLLVGTKGPSWAYLEDFSLAGGKTPLPGQVRADGGNPLQVHQPFWGGAELLRGIKEVSP